ncbi:hypothetical protein IV203_030156 [Nitzschia inconspicua]|uniref:Uncharacterized protein n=1 Tax=Nitzschia inconspicua TaxID=303405 RepID=A0A9K3LT50_9STRA|nr:hypothetical protein IV203_004889 [Nitzschia inconspicua]KAG7367485.1 hypothetical protein IV203_030156 [Nitzschia inconspicua]
MVNKDKNDISSNDTMSDTSVLQERLDAMLVDNVTVSMSNPEQETALTPKRRSSLVVHRIPEEESKTSTRKNVRFMLVDKSDSNDGQGNSYILPLEHKLTDELCHVLWYQKPEINAMKQDAKRVVLNRQNATSEELIGLERFDSQRALWKRSAIHYVLMAQKQRQGEDFIRRVAKRCSGWARETAIQQGFKDYCAVHDPLASLFGSEEENYNDFFFSDPLYSTHTNDSHSNHKRKTPDTEELSSECTAPDRCVRQRTTVTVETDD